MKMKRQTRETEGKGGKGASGQPAGEVRPTFLFFSTFPGHFLSETSSSFSPLRLRIRLSASSSASASFRLGPGFGLGMFPSATGDVDVILLSSSLLPPSSGLGLIRLSESPFSSRSSSGRQAGLRRSLPPVVAFLGVAFLQASATSFRLTIVLLY